MTSQEQAIETIFVDVDFNDPNTALMISMGKQPHLGPKTEQAIEALQKALGVDAPWLYLTGGRAYSPRIYLVDGEPKLRWGSEYIPMDTLLDHGSLFADGESEMVLQYTVLVQEGVEAVFNLRCAVPKEIKVKEAVTACRRSLMSLKTYLSPEGSMIPFLERHKEEFTYPLNVSVLGVHSKEMKDWGDSRGPQPSMLVKISVNGSPYLVKANYKTCTILSSDLIKPEIEAIGVVNLGKTRLNLVSIQITEDCFKIPF